MRVVRATQESLAKVDETLDPLEGVAVKVTARRDDLRQKMLRNAVKVKNLASGIPSRTPVRSEG